MLVNTLGIRLLFWIGSVVPEPAPKALQDALVSVEVTNDAELGDGFQLTFRMTKTLLGDFDLLHSSDLAANSRVILAVLVGALPQALIHGVITHQQVKVSPTPGESTLTVTGTDLSVLLDRTEKNRSYANQPDSVYVTRLLASYAFYGIVPAVIPTTDIPVVLDRTPWQYETDLSCIQRLAASNGYVFYLEPASLFACTAYFGPEVRVGIPQAAITLDLGAADNALSLHFSCNSDLPVQAKGMYQVPGTRLSLPIPGVSLQVPLAMVRTKARRALFLRDTASKSLLQAMLRVSEAQMQGQDPVRAEGEIDTVRYGQVLRARKLVGVRGAGWTFDGFYYVSKVTHNIEKGKYTQSFSLRREGTGALLPVVVP